MKRNNHKANELYYDEKKYSRHANGPPESRRYDVFGMGNPLVDVLVTVEDHFLAENDLNRGIMHLVDKDRKNLLQTLVQDRPKIIEIGGSCPNTISTLAQLGVRVALTGKIGDDEYGRAFEEKTISRGIDSYLRRGDYDTGVCTIFITPDKERTMNTYLGACREYSVDDLPVEAIANSRFFYFTGYMWDTKHQKEAISYALEIAKKHGVSIVFDVADPFAVERHRGDFLHIIKHSVDIVFANAQEAHLLRDAHLVSTSDVREAAECLGSTCELAVVKNGGGDTLMFESGSLLTIPSFSSKVLDTTGAGDNFAAGFLFGLIKGYPIELCGRIASFVAAKTIEKIGAQVPENIGSLLEASSAQLMGSQDKG
jgi:sugar/nucleoside kinase (ribokinase family)